MGHLPDEALTTPFGHLCLLLRPLTHHPFHTPRVNTAQASGYNAEVEQETWLSFPLYQELGKKTKGQLSPRKEPVGPCWFRHHHTHLETKVRPGEKDFHVRGGRPLARPAYPHALNGFTPAFFASAELMKRGRNSDSKKVEKAGPSTAHDDRVGADWVVTVDTKFPRGPKKELEQ